MLWLQLLAVLIVVCLVVFGGELLLHRHFGMGSARQQVTKHVALTVFRLLSGVGIVLLLATSSNPHKTLLIFAAAAAYFAAIVCQGVVSYRRELISSKDIQRGTKHE